MKINIIASVFALAMLLFSGCAKDLIGVEAPNTPTSVFYQIWKDFDENYGLFDVKNINWDSTFTTVGSQVTDQMTDRELYDAVVSMLAPLHDRHITLYPASSPGLPRWSDDLTDDGVYVTEDFDFEVVKTKYVTDFHEPLPFIQYGWLTPEVAYLHIQHMDGKRKDYEKVLDEAIGFFKNAKGLVLDIRDNSGGFDPIAQYVAGRFASEKQLYMTTRKRNGPSHDDFTDTQEWRVKPEGSTQFTRPIAVLTTAATASAAETFLLAMRTQAHVTQVGATTSGSFSDAPMWEASNGWMYTISVGDYRAADGQSYEGIGLVPADEVKNLKEDLLVGKDAALEKAIELLK